MSATVTIPLDRTVTGGKVMAELDGAGVKVHHNHYNNETVVSCSTVGLHQLRLAVQRVQEPGIEIRESRIWTGRQVALVGAISATAGAALSAVLTALT